MNEDEDHSGNLFEKTYVQHRTSAVADSMTDYLGNLEGAIVTNATNFYGDDIKTIIFGRPCNPL